MDDLTEFLSDCFLEVTSGIIGTVAVTKGTITKPAVMDSAERTKTFLDPGLWEKVSHTLEFHRDHFDALGITDRSILTVVSKRPDGTVIKTDAYRVHGLDGDDPGDPTVLVYIGLAHLS